MNTQKRKTAKECEHINVKVRKHRVNPYPCVHCLDCNAIWGDAIRALNFLRKAKSLTRII
jgi:hypothetical protein